MNYLQKKTKEAYDKYKKDKNLNCFLEECFNFKLDDCHNYEMESIDLEKLRVKVRDKNNANHYYDLYYTYDKDFISFIPKSSGQSYIKIKEYNDNYTREKVYSTYSDKYCASRITLTDSDYQLLFDRYCQKGVNGSPIVENCYDIIYHICNLPNTETGQNLLRKKYCESFSNDKRQILKQETTYSLGCYVEKKDSFDDYCYFTPAGVIYGINSCVNEKSNIEYMRGICFEDINSFCDNGKTYKDYLPMGGIWANNSDDIGDMYVDSKIYLIALDNNHVFHILEVNKNKGKITGKYILNDLKTKKEERKESEFEITNHDGNINCEDLLMLNEYLSLNYDDEVMPFFVKEIDKFKKAIEKKNIFDENTINLLLNPEILINLDDDYIMRLTINNRDKFLRNIDDEFCLKTGTKKNELGKAKIKIKK